MPVNSPWAGFHWDTAVHPRSSLSPLHQDSRCPPSDRTAFCNTKTLYHHRVLVVSWYYSNLYTAYYGSRPLPQTYCHEINGRLRQDVFKTALDASAICYFTKYRVTCIIVNNSESKNLHVVNFINRQTLHRSIGMIANVIWGKYYTVSCSGKIIILNNAATPENCTITRRQRYFKTMCRLSISTEQCLLCFWWLPSVCQASNWWYFAQWSKKLTSNLWSTQLMNSCNSQK